MTEEERAEIAVIVSTTLNEELNKRSRISEATHHAHHRFIELRIEEVEARKELTADIKKKVIGWGFIVSIGAAITLLGEGILSHLDKLKG